PPPRPQLFPYTTLFRSFGYPAISYNYRNRPDLKHRKDGVSPIHYGGAVIEIVGDPATGLNGEYWTDRNSRGEFNFREQSPRIARSEEHTSELQSRGHLV